MASEESLCEIEKWGEREKQSTEYARIQAAEDNEWLLYHREANEAALEEMRRLIPANISEISTSELCREVEARDGFYSHELLSEFKNNKILHWIVTHPDDIAKSNFLAGEHRQYFVNIEGLDVVEMRALRLCLPEKFELDKDGQKAEWRERFIAKLKQMVSQDCEEVVKGGWDPDCGKRAMVAMPPLSDEQKRRSVYFYKTHSQLLKRLTQLKQRDLQLAEKERQLALSEEEEKACRLEYDVILEESRNPAYKELYGVEALLEAKDHAKKDLLQAEGKRRKMIADIQRLQSLIRESNITKEAMASYIEQHISYLTMYDWDKVDVLVQIAGVFESCPEINRIERVSAKFVTAEEEAEHRKNEISAMKREPTPVAFSQNDTADGDAVTLNVTPRLKRMGSSILESTNSELVNSLNKVLRSTITRSVSSAGSTDKQPLHSTDRVREQHRTESTSNSCDVPVANIAVVQPIRSKHLKVGQTTKNIYTSCNMFI